MGASRHSRGGSARLAAIVACVALFATVVVLFLPGRKPEPIAHALPATEDRVSQQREVAHGAIDSTSSSSPSTPISGRAPDEEASPVSGRIRPVLSPPNPNAVPYLVKGRVVDQAGDGIGGAMVARFAPRDPFFAPSPLGEYTTTESDGNFTLELMVVDHLHELRSMVLQAEASGYATAATQAECDEAEGRADFILRRAPQSIAGRVVYQGTEDPVAGARLYIIPPATNEIVLFPFVGYVTGPDGTFRFDDLLEDEAYTVNVRLGNFFYQQSEKAGAMDVLLSIPDRRVRYFGVLRDSVGQPVPNEMITAQSISGYSDGGSAFRVTTDEDGFWEMIVEGDLLFFWTNVRNPPSGSFHLASVSVHRQEAKDVEVELELPPAYTLTGRIVIEETNEGLAGLQVFAPSSGFHEDRFLPEPKTVSDMDGRFLINLPVRYGNAIYRLVAPEGYSFRFQGRHNYILETQVHHSLHSTQQDVLILARPTEELRIRVLQSDRTTPAVGATIFASGVRVVAGEDGLATLRVAHGGELPISITYNEKEHSHSLDFSAHRKGDIHEIVLQRLAAVEILVRGAEPEELRRMHLSIMNSPVPGMRRSSQHSGSLDQTGRLFAEGLAPGVTHTISLTIHNPARFLPVEPVEITLEEGEIHESVIFELQRGESMLLRVRDDKGDPLDGVSAYLTIVRRQLTGESREQVAQPFTPTGRAGEYTASGLDSSISQLRLNVSLDGYKSHSLTLPAGIPSQPVEVTLSRAREVLLEVVDRETGLAVPRFRFQILPLARSQFLSIRGDDASHSKSQVNSPGDYVFHVQSGQPGTINFRHAIVPFNVGEDDWSVFVRAELLRAAVVPVRVFDGSSGQPMEGVRLSGIPAHSSPSQSLAMGAAHVRAISEGLTDPTGVYTFYGVPSGVPFAISASKDGYENHVSDPRIFDASQDNRLDIQLQKGGRIVGRVTGVDGMPASGASLGLQPRSGMSGARLPQAVTNQDGEYELSMQQGGEQNLILTYEGATLTVPLEIPDEHPAGREFRRDFDLSEFVHLTVSVTLNGDSVGEMPFHSRPMLSITTRGGRAGHGTTGHSADGQGMFRLLILPGAVQVSLFGPGISTPIPAMDLDIPPSPPMQELELEFVGGSVDIVLVYPSPQDIEPGRITMLKHRPDQPAQKVNSALVSGELASLRMLEPGVYTFTFASGNQRWKGRLTEVSVAPGPLQTLVMDVFRDDSLVRVGGWTPESTSTGFSPIRIDITRQIEGASSVTIIFAYESGIDALMISRVAVLINGVERHVNLHSGWAGSRHSGNVYTFDLGEVVPGDLYTIEAVIRAGNTSDSTGSIYLMAE